MDEFSRKILHWIFQKSVRKIDVVKMSRWLHLCYNLKGVIIRNDNGSQFLANDVRNFLIHLEEQQEFTHVATQEKYAYIEAFHSILQRESFDSNSAVFMTARRKISAVVQYRTETSKTGTHYAAAKMEAGLFLFN